MNAAQVDRRNILDRWSAALARGDDAEVDRLVQQSRTDRVRGAAEQLGTISDQADRAAANRG